MIGFWILATCECGVFASANIDFCLYCIGGSVFVDHEGCGPQLTTYHEYHCPNATPTWIGVPRCPQMISRVIPSPGDGADYLPSRPKGPAGSGEDTNKVAAVVSV